MRRNIIALIFFVVYFSTTLPAQVDTTKQADTLKTYKIDEVVVTGTRTSKKIIDVPYSIERLPNIDFKFDKKVSVNDVLGSVPGLFLQSRYGNHDVRISIRGFGSRSNSGIRGVRILMDGIPESEPDGQTRLEALDFHSVGSIEVVKGNSSSLYTNAPGGVINFISDINFQKSFAVNFNEFGSFGLTSNGFKSGVRSDKYGFLTTYNYHSGRGYRQHSEDNWHILNTVLETIPGDNSRLHIYGYYVDGLIRLPGSLTKAQYNADPLQPNRRDVGRDAKRITKKGRLGVQFNSFFGETKNNELELTTYSTVKYFERTARTYRVFNRNGIGGSLRLVNRSELFGRSNEFSLGGDIFFQTGPIEEYNNINGKKGDILNGITNESIANTGFYIQNSFGILPEKMDVLLTGRYDKVLFDHKNQILEVQNDTKQFNAFTPKVALNYKITPAVAAYTSFGLGFDTPAANELDNFPTSSNPNSLLNPDLQPQRSKNFEIGIKGNLLFADDCMFNKIYFDATIFQSTIEDEIVPFEVFGDVFYRNSAKTARRGLELGVSTEIMKDLRWRTAYTFSHFTYDEYTARTIELDTTGNFVSIDRSFAGNVVPSVPKHHLSTVLSYENHVSECVTGFWKGNYVYAGGMFTDDRNSEKTLDYHVVNSTVGADMKFRHFNILISTGLNNIFNRSYVGFININSASGEFYEAGEPRNFFASINMGYEF